jgi:hypothetical protein
MEYDGARRARHPTRRGLTPYLLPHIVGQELDELHTGITD